MKKILYAIIAVALAGVLSVVGYVIFKDKNVYATNLQATTQNLQLQVGDTYQIEQKDFCIEPLNYTGRIVYSSDNQQVATVDIFDGTITAVSAGVCNIVVTAKTSKTDTIFCKIAVQVFAEPMYPTDVQISSTNIQVVVNTYTALNTIITGYCTIRPQASTQNNLIDYDFATDKIYARQVGNDVLTLVYQLADGTTKKFEIAVEVILVPTEQKYLEFSISQQTFANLEYTTNSAKEDCILTIEYGADVVFVAVHDYKHIVVAFSKTGTAKIVMQSPTKTCIFLVTIVD